jgi:DNA adenine methylase
VYISDINRELICTYTTIRDNFRDLVELLQIYEQEYLLKCEEGRKEIYYRNRERFNALKFRAETGTELAALFIFLNRTCFNGLYRVNSKGGFNVPQGDYKNPCICDKTNLYAVSKKLQGVEIIHGDYRQSTDFIDEKTFAYFDPPYRPLSATSNFTAYAQDGFCDKAQIELSKFIDEMNERGAFILASNSDPKNTDEADGFFDLLYDKYRILRIGANRAINSAGKGRGKINELLICSLGG